jgi:RNA recognition motif-containing protein
MYLQARTDTHKNKYMPPPSTFINTGDVTEGDLHELFRPFGPISRVFLAVDRATGENRGFAFVNYHLR